MGSCLANILATRGHSVVLIDRSVRGLPGSTGHAPGYVGQFNAVPALTTLAVRSVERYVTIPKAFNRVGGLEVALTDAEQEKLEKRCAEAKLEGMSATLVDAAVAHAKAPFFVVESKVKGALWFENDGTADGPLIALYEQQQAQAKGAKLVDADVVSVEQGRVILSHGLGTVEADNVVVCAGIWTTSLLAGLSVVPVAHPYAYTQEREARQLRTPFVRYPETHIYVRDHGLKDGVGCYAHDPIAVAQSEITHSAYGAWHSSFEQALTDSLSVLPTETRDTFDNSPQTAGKDRVFNGLFSVTPDALPLVGKVKQGNNVYVATAAWVTHAAGCALLAADIIDDTVHTKDDWLVSQLDPHRFDGRESGELQSQALSTYNDIYNKELATASNSAGLVVH